jgi:hypothetical protein
MSGEHRRQYGQQLVQELTAFRGRRRSSELASQVRLGDPDLGRVTVISVRSLRERSVMVWLLAFLVSIAWPLLISALGYKPTATSPAPARAATIPYVWLPFALVFGFTLLRLTESLMFTPTEVSIGEAGFALSYLVRRRRVYLWREVRDIVEKDQARQFTKEGTLTVLVHSEGTTRGSEIVIPSGAPWPGPKVLRHMMEEAKTGARSRV